jgi:hypothetical protein
VKIIWFRYLFLILIAIHINIRWINTCMELMWKFFIENYQSWVRLTRRVPLVEQELLTLPEHINSPPVFSGVHVTRSLFFYVCFVDRCLSFCTFSFRHCVVCSSSIYGLWFWYLQTLFVFNIKMQMYLYIYLRNWHTWKNREIFG